MNDHAQETPETRDSDVADNQRRAIDDAVESTKKAVKGEG